MRGERGVAIETLLWFGAQECADDTTRQTCDQFFIQAAITAHVSSTRQVASTRCASIEDCFTSTLGGALRTSCTASGSLVCGTSCTPSFVVADGGRETQVQVNDGCVRLCVQQIVVPCAYNHALHRWNVSWKTRRLRSVRTSATNGAQEKGLTALTCICCSVMHATFERQWKCTFLITTP